MAISSKGRISEPTIRLLEKAGIGLGHSEKKIILTNRTSKH